MRVRTYVLVVSVALIIMSSGSKDAKPTIGLNPGDLAPGIESLGNESDFSFQNHSGRYTLLNFWAAYDAESRVRNVQLMNEINKSGSDKVVFRSFSLDEKESIFTETVKIDRIDETTQFYAAPAIAADLYEKYHLEKGFTSFLIDDKGVIVASNVNSDSLTEVLNRI